MKIQANAIQTNLNMLSIELPRIQPLRRAEPLDRGQRRRFGAGGFVDGTGRLHAQLAGDKKGGRDHWGFIQKSVKTCWKWMILAVSIGFHTTCWWVSTILNHSLFYVDISGNFEQALTILTLINELNGHGSPSSLGFSTILNCWTWGYNDIKKNLWLLWYIINT